ncbi:hypothetical protein GUITHDRAFT_106353 [Guillardia theta CCMP2712]|uniref:WW domain-containing protein n=1 Tax=Guillardia theta (strain CCMP2712) TaxID=905079 RepID=L1JI45_GUITC|nr:hypothetical protein GUITHDRAFT_106353 [Guillardia theta CCMP2712]EKX47799.1 hypothetical protein GUITHDRAFT_106353 [Guillardia theta CCMP2712]|eukprot:XP_005834779.1 hypothetical protein GUITHDRAFT_106353 [Guillardia theta CCMP2712]
MVILKEYRIVMPVTVEEYKIAQIYMTAKTQSMEAEQPNGAGDDTMRMCDLFFAETLRSGVEILENTQCVHPTMGPGIYTKKHYHIERRFPGWLRAIAPKSGMTLVETAHNCYPHVVTELRLPLFHKFLMRVETIHAQDRGDSFNIHKLDDKKLKQREIVYVDISEKDDHHKKKKMYDKDNTDPRTFKSVRTGRGPLVGNWQSSSEPVMCAYKLVTCEFDYWPFQHKIEEFMHSYERSIFLNANRSMFCWMDEWHGLSVEQVRIYEEMVTERTNKITAIKEGKLHGRIEDIPEVHPPSPETAEGEKEQTERKDAVAPALNEIIKVEGVSDANVSADNLMGDKLTESPQENGNKGGEANGVGLHQASVNGDRAPQILLAGPDEAVKVEVEKPRDRTLPPQFVSSPAVRKNQPHENGDEDVKLTMSDGDEKRDRLMAGSSTSLPENHAHRENSDSSYGQYEIIQSGQAVCSIECKLEVQPRQDSLPEGWEQRFDEEGRVFYVDHVNCITQWNKPN